MSGRSNNDPQHKSSSLVTSQDYQWLKKLVMRIFLKIPGLLLLYLNVV